MLGAIGDALGLGDAPPPPPPAPPATFIKGDPIDAGAEEAKGDYAPRNDNPLDTPEPIEFIHYGWVHPDRGNNFPHGDPLDDSAWPKLGNQKARAIAYRAALLRETLLLDGQLAACRKMVAEYVESKGSLGDIANIASSAMSMLGGGGGAPAAAPPKPEDLDPLLDRVSLAGGSINKDSIEYLPIHKAGIDLHQVRSEYNTYVMKRLAGKATEQAPADPSAALLAALPEPVATFQKYLFKMQEIYLQMYVSVCEKAEPQITRACHALSLNGVRQRSLPMFPLWSPAEPPPEEPPPAAPEEDRNVIEQAVDEANKAMKEAAAKVDQLKKDVEDFLGMTEAEKAPGDPYLKQAFDALDKDAPDWMTASFKAVIMELPGFLATLVKEVTKANLMLLRAACVRLMMKPAEPISDQMLVEAGRHVITQQVLKLLGNFAPTDLLQGKGGGVTGIAGKFVGDRVIGFLDDNVSSKVDFIIRMASSGLAQQLNDTRALSVANNSLTMEPYLGRVPWWLAQRTKNVVFPIWDMILKLVFGSVTGALGGPLDSLESAFGSVKDTAGDAKKAMDRVSQFKGVGTEDAGEIAKLADDPTGYLKDKLFGDGPAAPPPSKFPGSPRLTSASGVEVPPGAGETDVKWDTSKPEEAAA